MTGFEFGFSWITDGKEIENYLSKENIKLAFDENLKDEYSINSKKPFGDLLNEKCKKKYISSKKEFANEIVEKMEIEYLENNESLHSKVEHLYEVIQKWNEV
ncbi:MAG: hypothetical protein KAI67_06335 [Candidatus Pacebacteria bacterium]|nr:hypothetical protein [Candidatus Paceibacterota bacterium]